MRAAGLGGADPAAQIVVDSRGGTPTPRRGQRAPSSTEAVAPSRFPVSSIRRADSAASPRVPRRSAFGPPKPAGVVMRRPRASAELYVAWAGIVEAVRYARALGLVGFGHDRHVAAALSAIMGRARRRRLRAAWARLAAAAARTRHTVDDGVAAWVAAGRALAATSPVVPLGVAASNRLVVGTRFVDVAARKAPPATVFGRARRPCCLDPTLHVRTLNTTSGHSTVAKQAK